MERLNKKQKVVFFGTSEFAVPALDALIKNKYDVVAVVTSPDKPAGRGKKIGQSPVKARITKHSSADVAHQALQNTIILQPEKLDDDFLLCVSGLKPHIGVVAAYGKILPKSLIDMFPKGILNIHPSLLPKYRGPSPIQTTILNGDAETGVTMILLDEKMDHGPIIAQSKEMELGGGVVDFTKLTFIEMHDILAKLGAKLLIEAIPQWLNEKIKPIPQNDADTSYTKLIKKDDGKIDWASFDVKYIERMVRAYNSWPGTFMYLKSAVLKIKKVEIIENIKNLPVGQVFESNGYPAIVCKNGALKLLTVQLEGKREMDGKSFLLGHSKIIGKNPL